MAKILDIFKRKKDTLEERLISIKEGDTQERENLIAEYTPFIIKSITKVTNRYIETENDDEYSLGLEAFNEAINKYDIEKGKFLSFAQLLIRNKIIDYLRKESSKETVISIDEENANSGVSCHAIGEEDFTDKLDMKNEIIKFQRQLEEFDISVNELVESSPKHIDTRLNSISIARYIVENGHIKEKLLSKKVMPVKQLTTEINVSNKVLKRNRKFIIATVLILNSNSQLLKNYIEEVERRE
ncbi:RNA polymerase sigma-I factor [Sporosalibacterium faouarense]|uniref:RNA polymerase sigma-I factor n=1 Tax=Sporosalibacterium faouarense TaxID=516123 RepID=UPI00141C0D25|nr:RNA polymerase sigma-I factor [Sporosalibacterium faouarense]MTI48692.1 RNA polymerase sigma-I factor [Bacillota bacterium]